MRDSGINMCDGSIYAMDFGIIKICVMDLGNKYVWWINICDGYIGINMCDGFTYMYVWCINICYGYKYKYVW